MYILSWILGCLAGLSGIMGIIIATDAIPALADLPAPMNAMFWLTDNIANGVHRTWWHEVKPKRIIQPTYYIPYKNNYILSNQSLQGYFSSLFTEADYKDYIKNKKFDHILYLSVWHHHIVGYDKTDEYMQITYDVIKAANKTIYFEIDPKHLLKIHKTIESFITEVELKARCKFQLISKISEESNVIDYKFDRRIYKIEK